MTELHLVRHADVAVARPATVYGHLDVPLSPAGHAQSLRLADWLAETVSAPFALWGSDLERCVVLGETIARHTGVAYRPLPALREQHMGAWEGRTWDDLTRDDPAAVSGFWSDYVATRPPGGECFGDVAERVEATLDELTRGGARRLVVVTHAGVVRAACCHFLGVALDQALRFAPATASRTTFQCHEAGAVLTTFGARPP
ncbi:MAG: histidine phosphatase family protein [Myxococcota bacterium]